jgi:hypothetical protein
LAPARNRYRHEQRRERDERQPDGIVSGAKYQFQGCAESVRRDERLMCVERHAGNEQPPS